MKSTAEGQRPARWHAMRRDLAPHVNDSWAQSFVVELRLLGVQGVRIGAALSEVESHCSESGQSAQRAFGAPVDYARSLQLPVEGEHSPAATVRSLVPMTAQVPGMLVLALSFGAWLSGQSLTITAGYLLIASVVLLAMVAAFRFADSWLRTAVYHLMRFLMVVFLAYLGIAATCVVAIEFLDGVLWSGSAGWGLAAGASALVAGVVWAIARRRAVGSDEDPITSPFEGVVSSINDQARGSRGRLFDPDLLSSLIDLAIVPVMTVILLAVTLVLR
jgi:hypothetical protein